MARTINEQDYAVKRNQILDVTQRLIYTKGYEQMAIQDILDELRISKGAFYHYFDSKPALLEAVIERIQHETQQLLNPIVEDAHLPALAKLQRYFDAAVQWKTARKALLIELLRIWYTDHNAIVRQKMWATLSKQALPLLTSIFQQGVREGVFNAPFPEQIGPIVLSMIQSLGDGFAELLLVDAPHGDERQRAERIVAAYNDALERVLGAPVGSVKLMDAAALEAWFGPPSAPLPASIRATSNIALS